MVIRNHQYGYTITYGLYTIDIDVEDLVGRVYRMGINKNHFVCVIEDDNMLDVIFKCFDAVANEINKVNHRVT